MWDSVLAQFGLLSGLETLIRSWQIRLVFGCLFLLHNWMFDCLTQSNHVHCCQSQAAPNIYAYHGLGPFYKLWRSDFFHATSGFGFVIRAITPFSKGDFQCRLCKSFAYGASDTKFSIHIFSFQEVLSVVRLVNIHHAPEMFLIWGGAKSGSSACSCKWCSQIFSVS